MNRYKMEHRLDGWGQDHIDAVIYGKGDWCKWEDVQTIQRENDKLREIPKRLREQADFVFKDEDKGTFIKDLLDYSERLVDFALLTKEKN